MQTDVQSDVGCDTFQNSYEFGATGSSTTSESKLASTDGVVRKRANKKQSSPIWNYFERCEDQPNFARCIICGSKYQHSSNTSNLAKHLKTKHVKEWQACEEEKKEMELAKKRKSGASVDNTIQPTLTAVINRSSMYPKTSARKQKIDQALVSMVVNDLVPPSMIEDKGFKEFVCVLDPRYDLPSRRTLMRSLLPTHYTSAKETLLQQLREVDACAITTDFWSSCNAESYITVTCHFLTPEWELKSCVLATCQVKMDHTAENISAELIKIANEWGIADKICCIITDNAANMMAAARLTQWRHLPCFAHTLNLIVQEATENDEELAELRRKCRNIVMYFKQSIKARDKLSEVQKQMGREEKKLIRDVITRWNSSFYMYERLIEEYQAVNTTLVYFDHTHLCLSSSEIEIMKDVCKILQHFEHATREISADKYLSVSKVIPLARSLQRLTVECVSSHGTLKQELLRSMAKRFTGLESHYSLAVSTLLDPRFKKIGFGDTSACNQAVQRLTMEVACSISASSDNRTSTAPSVDSSSTAEQEPSALWSFIDNSVATQQSRPSTVDSKIVVRTYLEQPNLARKEDPLKWWAENQITFPFLVPHAKKFLTIPATSVPSERLFSKAGEITAGKCNRVKSKNVDMLLFLNKVIK